VWYGCLVFVLEWCEVMVFMFGLGELLVLVDVCALNFFDVLLVFG